VVARAGLPGLDPEDPQNPRGREGLRCPRRRRNRPPETLRQKDRADRDLWKARRRKAWAPTE